MKTNSEEYSNIFFWQSITIGLLIMRIVQLMRISNALRVVIDTAKVVSQLF